jgi:UPF0755 protein
MNRKKVDDKFPLKDKLKWWGSNVLGLAVSIVLVISLIISAPFKGFNKMSGRWVLRILFMCAIFCAIIGAYEYYTPQQAKSFGAKTKYLIVRRGDNVFDISYKLKQMGAITSRFEFVIFSKLPWHAKKLKAGRYAIDPGNSMAKIFGLMIKGASVPFVITIPEGLTISQTAEQLSSQLEFDPTEFLAACSDRLLLDSLDISGDDLEGYLFPNTYDFFYDEPAPVVARKMAHKFFDELPKDFEQKAAKQGLDFDEAVIIASLIEKEAMVDKERPIISAVYNLRLRKRMLLQCDPTVIYALGGENRPLYYSDLQVESPYNTYKYPGLPPGPICSPGKASLEAAVNPADVEYLYFVAKGDGTHFFSYTNDEHEIAKRKVRRTKLWGITP